MQAYINEFAVGRADRVLVYVMAETEVTEPQIEPICRHISASSLSAVPTGLTYNGHLWYTDKSK